MSRIGRMPIALPAGVTVDIAENNKVTVKGPKGTLERVLPAEMDIKLEGSEVVVNKTKRPKEDEVFTRLNKNINRKHGNWCYSRLRKSIRSKWCWL